jgi:hypothetical protein
MLDIPTPTEAEKFFKHTKLLFYEVVGDELAFKMLEDFVQTNCNQF